MTENPVICIDLETTGLNANQNEIFEMAFIKLDKDLNITEEKLHAYVRVERPELFSLEAQKVTGITVDQIMSFPEISKIKNLLIDWLKYQSKDYKIIPMGQNYIKFDQLFLKKFLDKDLNYSFYDEIFEPAIDLINLAKHYDYIIDYNKLNYTKFNKYNLKRISQYCKVINEGAHNAYYDTITTAKCYKKIHDFLKNFRPQEVA